MTRERFGDVKTEVIMSGKGEKGAVEGRNSDRRSIKERYWLIIIKEPAPSRLL